MKIIPGQLETVIRTAAVADLVRSIDALRELWKEIGGTTFGVSRLSRYLQRLNETLSQPRHQVQGNDGKSLALDLCICCCRLLLAHVEARLRQLSSNSRGIAVSRLIERLKREFWDWRLGNRVARQNEAFLSILQANDWYEAYPFSRRLSYKDNLLAMDEASKRHLRTSERWQKHTALIRKDTISLFEHPAACFVPEVVMNCFRRRMLGSHIREHLVRKLCDWQYHTSTGAPLQDYIGIKNSKQRSRFIDHALANDLKRRRGLCQIVIEGDSGEEERVLAEIDELREPGTAGSALRKPGFFRQVKINIGHVQVRISQYARSSERKRWIHYFDQTEATMLVIDIASYNVSLSEDSGITRFAYSLSLYDSMVNHPFFRGVPMILVLDNVDGFCRKLQSDPLERYLPEYSGGTDVRVAAGFILDKLAKMNKGSNLVYPIFASDSITCTESFCCVVQEIMLCKALRER